MNINKNLLGDKGDSLEVKLCAIQKIVEKIMHLFEKISYIFHYIHK